MPANHRAIDCWVNVTMGDGVPPEFLQRVKQDYFKGGDEFFTSLTPDQTIEAMDEAGVDKAVLVVEVGHPSPTIMEFLDRYPDRFFLAAMVDPTKGLGPLWALEEMVAAYPVIMAKVVPFSIDVAPSDAVYYPLYTKCTELDLPLTVNTGLPGPPMPGECQHPLHLDRVCHRFPHLRLVMAHGADPWWDVAIRLMIKYTNLTLMTSAYSPKYFPDELVHFMNTRGQDKIMYSSDHPVLSMQHCVGEAGTLDLRDGVLDKFLRANAERVFFSPRQPHPRKNYLR